MSHIIGRGRYARETYPGRSAGSAGSEILNLYGSNALASEPAVEYTPTRAEAGFETFGQQELLEEGALVALPNAYPIGSFTAKRVVYGGAGPMIGDADITYELLQSIDDGLNFTPIEGGAATVLTFAPNESGVKTVAVNRTVPANALICVRATYPANFDPQGDLENVFFAMERGIAA